MPVTPLEAVLLQLCSAPGPEGAQLSDHPLASEQFGGQGNHKTQHGQPAIPALGLIGETPVVKQMHDRHNS